MRYAFYFYLKDIFENGKVEMKKFVLRKFFKLKVGI